MRPVLEQNHLTAHSSWNRGAGVYKWK